MYCRIILMVCSRQPLRLQYARRLEMAVQRQFRGTTVYFASHSSFDELGAARSQDLPPGPPSAIVLFADSLPTLLRDAKTSNQRFPITPVLAAIASQRMLQEIPEQFFDMIQDHVVCPFNDDDFGVRLQRMMTASQVPVDVLNAACVGNSTLLLGESAAFVQALATLARITSADATCLLEGETGTGKELFARAIHYSGRRRSSPFVPVNCGALPEALMENELFGHARGAYTDARNDDKGLVASAEDGTLFLDEVDGLSAVAQVKLLRFLQEGEYRALGSTAIRKSQARIIAASNTSLRERVRQGAFREDLFHRLNILRLRIPPLRERGGDVILLARAFLHSYLAQHKVEPKTLHTSALDLLQSYEWPGNVRELQAVMQRCALLSKGPAIAAADLDLEEVACRRRLQSVPLDEDMSVAKARLLNEFEEAFVRQALIRWRGNVSQAARAAGKDRRSFQRLLKKYGIFAADPQSTPRSA